MPSVSEISVKLKRRFKMAVEVTNRRIGARKKLMPVNSRIGGHIFSSDDLIYIKKSPDYCVKDVSVGSLGTRYR